MVFTVSSALIGDDLEFTEGPISIAIDLEKGVITSIERHAEGIDLRGLMIMPPLANMHIHALDLAIAEEGWDLDIDTVVGEPYGLKYMLLAKLPDNELRNALDHVIKSSLRNGIGILVEFREFGIKGLNLGFRGHKNHFILSMPSTHEIDEKTLERMIKVSDGLGISSPTYFKDEVLKKMFRVSKGKYLMAHIAEVSDTREEGDLEKLLKHGRPTAIIHGVWLNESDIELVKSYEVPLILCLRSNKWFLSGLPNLKAIYEHGLLIGLGTDNAGWVKNDLWREGEELLLMLRLSGITDALWVLKAMTVNAGKILKIKYAVCEGCQANIAFLDHNSLLLDSVKNKYLSIVKRGGPEYVYGVMIYGELKYVSGRVKTLCSGVCNSIS